MNEQPAPDRKEMRVSLVAGDPTSRHGRQITLRSHGYDVRSYATFAALIADPGTRDHICIIADLTADAAGGVAMLAAMRGSGWRGRAILFAADNNGEQVMQHGDLVVAPGVGDGALLKAIEACIDDGRHGSNA